MAYQLVDGVVRQKPSQQSPHNRVGAEGVCETEWRHAFGTASQLQPQATQRRHAVSANRAAASTHRHTKATHPIVSVASFADVVRKQRQVAVQRVHGTGGVAVVVSKPDPQQLSAWAAERSVVATAWREGGMA